MNIEVLFKTYLLRVVESPSPEYVIELDQHEVDGHEHPDSRLRQHHHGEILSEGL